MKDNKFKIVIPSYNNKKWVEYNVASIINQTYKNYEVLYINDYSTDSTPQIVQNIINEHKLDNWTLLNHKKNKQRGYNVNPNAEHIINFMDNDDDILLFVDGDDWLYDENVLEKLNDFYKTNDWWMTYGGMYCWPSNNLAHPQNTEYSEEVHKNKSYRKDIWRASHLRSFRWFLYKKIKKEDLIWSKTKAYYYNAEDLAVSFYCMEMCPPSKIGISDFPTYVYNEDPEIVARGLSRQNKDINDPEGQEAEIRSKTPYETLPYKEETYIINPILAGGLGNMMFQIASAKGIASKNHKVAYDFNHVGILHKYPKDYKDNLFRKTKKQKEYLTNFETISVEPKDFRHQKIYLPKNNVKLGGYFQSPKYFNHIKDDILDLFSPTQKDLEYIEKKYKLGKVIVSFISLNALLTIFVPVLAISA